MGVDTDEGLIARAKEAAAATVEDAEHGEEGARAGDVAQRTAFRVGNILERTGGGGGDDEEGGGSWAVLRDEEKVWPSAGSGGGSGEGERRPFSVVVLFLVHNALAKVEPLVRELWERGGVSVVTLGGYHFKTWSYDRWDTDYEVRIIDAKKKE